MRPALRVYIGLVVSAATLLGTWDVRHICSWPYPWELYQVALLLIVCIVATNFTFLMHGGWYTAAGTVPEIAAAFLLPPGLAEAVAALGALSRVARVRMAWPRAAFNTAKSMLVVGVVAHIATHFGGPDLLSAMRDREDSLAGPAVALLMIGVYYVVDVSLVARAAAWDQRRSFWQLARARSGLKVVTDLALGLLGAAFGMFFLQAPFWTPALLFPGVLVFLGKKTMDSADRRSRHLELTSQVGRAVAGTLNPEQALQAIVDSGVIDALKLDGLAFLPVADPPPFKELIVVGQADQADLRARIARRAAELGQRVVISATRKGAIEAASWLEPSKVLAGMCAAAIPFQAGRQRVVGVLVAWRGAQRSNERAFSTEELLVVETLADYAAVALETAQLAEETGRLNRVAAQAEAKREALRQSEERFRSLVQNASDVIAIVNSAGAITYVSPAISQVLGRPPASLLDADLLDLVDPEQRNAARAQFQDALRRPAQNVSAELRLQHADGTWREFEVIATNMLNQPGVAGIVTTYRDITQRKAFERELTRLAFRDALTELPNRALFLDRLQRALAHAERQSHHVAVLFLDLDRFKVVNDSLGHQLGDALLIAVAARLSNCVRAEDTVSRLGGDEFTVLLEDIVEESEAIEVAERIADALRAPMMLDGHEVFVSASVGIALSRRNTDEPDTLLRNADLALYRAKAQGRARYAIFDPMLESSALQRLELETDLRHALDRGQLFLEYQPVVQLATNQVVGVEALVRWDRPGAGLIKPSEFIPIAEETGLIVPLGQWVLREACRQAREWLAEYGPDHPLIMNVNLSTRQFQNPGLHTDIVHILETVGLDPHRLKLEITESAIMQDADAAVEKMRILKELGIQLAIDDFGTGYSSLSHLKRFPVDTLKIDQSFVDGIGIDAQDAAIVSSVVALAKSLGLTVTGEGIETTAQAAYLQMLGCDRGQGYWYSKPLVADEILALLNRQAGETDLRSAA